MDLILWRHAEAEDGLDDLKRELTDKGRKQAARMAGWLNSRLASDASLLSSPAVRARQTAEALGKRLQIVDSLRPGASVQDILAAAGWPGHGEECVLVCGHQPDLGLVAAHLLGAQGSLSIRKGAIWWFGSRTQAGSPNPAVLRAVLAPEMLKP